MNVVLDKERNYETEWLYYFIVISIQPLGQFGQEPEPSQATGMASGTLHPGQVLRGNLPLLSPAFGLSHFRRHVPPRPQRRESS
jgi:hypothetical protein